MAGAGGRGLLRLVVLTLCVSAAVRAQEPAPVLHDPLESEALKRLEKSSAGAAAAGTELALLWLRSGNWTDAADLLQQSLELALDLEDAETTATARQLLAAVDRLCLRPAAGRPRWSAARTLRPSRGEIKKASGIAARGDGELLVSDGGSNMVLLIDGLGELERTWSVSKPQRPLWGPNGEVSVEARDGLTVLRGGEEMSERPAVEVEKRPQSGLANRARDVWRRVTAVVGRGGERQPREGSGVIDQVVDPAGYWWLLQADGAVVRLDNEEAIEQRLQLPPQRRPVAMTIDPMGNFYLLDQAEKRIAVFDREGRPVVVVGPSLTGGLELGRPEDIAVDDSGRLFIADSRRGVIILE